MTSKINPAAYALLRCCTCAYLATVAWSCQQVATVTELSGKPPSETPTSVTSDGLAGGANAAPPAADAAGSTNDATFHQTPGAMPAGNVPTAIPGPAATNAAEQTSAPTAPNPVASAGGPSSANSNEAASLPQPTAPAVSYPTLDWNDLLYAFYGDVFYQWGGADAIGPTLYLTANANFCVADPNAGVVNNTLTSKEAFVAIVLAPSVREPVAGSYVGPGFYSDKTFFVGHMVLPQADSRLPAGFCQAKIDTKNFAGDVTVSSDSNETIAFTVAVDLPADGNSSTATAAGNNNSHFNRQYAAARCRVNYQYNVATGFPSGNDAANRPANLYATKCVVPNASKRLRN